MAALLKEGARNFRCALFASSPWEYAAFYASVKARRCLARLVYPAIHGDRRERFSWSNIEFVGELHRNRFIICIVRAGSIAVYFDGRKIFEYSHNGDTAFCKRNSPKLLKSYRRTKNFSLLLNYSKYKLPTDLLPSPRSALSIHSTNFRILFEKLRMYKFLHDTVRSPTISMTANDVAIYGSGCSNVFVAEHLKQYWPSSDHLPQRSFYESSSREIRDAYPGWISLQGVTEPFAGSTTSSVKT